MRRCCLCVVFPLCFWCFASLCVSPPNMRTKGNSGWFETCELTLVLVKLKLAFLVFVCVKSVHGKLGKPWQEWEFSQWNDSKTENGKRRQLFVICQEKLYYCNAAARWRHCAVLHISLTIRQDDRLTFVSLLFIIPFPFLKKTFQPFLLKGQTWILNANNIN